MTFLHDFFVRFFETKPAASNAKPPETPLTRLFDNLRNRIIITGVLSVFLLTNVILGGTAFNYTPFGVYGALAWQVVLSLFIWFYSLAFFWRNLDGASERRCTIFFWLNIGVGLLWLTGFFSLAIELGKTQDALNYKPDGKTVTSYKPSIGCLVLDLFFCAIFSVNAVYVRTRKAQLFPKYAEIHESEQGAFDAAMTEGDYAGHGSDHDGSHHGAHTPPAAAHSPYASHSPQLYHPGQAPPPPQYDPAANYTQQAAYEEQDTYGAGGGYAPYGAAGLPAYNPGRTPYPESVYQGSAAEPRYPVQQTAYQSYGGHQGYSAEGA